MRHQVLTAENYDLLVAISNFSEERMRAAKIGATRIMVWAAVIFRFAYLLVLLCQDQIDSVGRLSSPLSWWDKMYHA